MSKKLSSLDEILKKLEDAEREFDEKVKASNLEMILHSEEEKRNRK